MSLSTKKLNAFRGNGTNGTEFLRKPAEQETRKEVWGLALQKLNG
jgi:hypothetical protein